MSGKASREKTPTQLSMELLVEIGYEAQVVEHKLKGGRTKDLFGCIDIVAAHPGHGILGVQATDRSNHSARFKKCCRSPVGPWLHSALLQVWSWRDFESFAEKVPSVRIQHVTLADLVELRMRGVG